MTACQPILPTEEKTNRLRADFLQIDVPMALRVSGLVLLADDPERKGRTMEMARKAYDTILRLKTAVSMTAADRQN